jgi:hypothetical protein
MFEINNEDQEWGILQKPIIVKKINPNNKIPRKSVSIEVSRSDSYQ